VSTKFELTLSKVAGFVCLAFAGLLMFVIEEPQYEQAAKWGMYGMAIFSVKNYTAKND